MRMRFGFPDRSRPGTCGLEVGWFFGTTRVVGCLALVRPAQSGQPALNCSSLMLARQLEAIPSFMPSVPHTCRSKLQDVS